MIELSYSYFETKAKKSLIYSTPNPHHDLILSLYTHSFIFYILIYLIYTLHNLHSLYFITTFSIFYFTSTGVWWHRIYKRNIPDDTELMKYKFENREFIMKYMNILYKYYIYIYIYKIINVYIIYFKFRNGAVNWKRYLLDMSTNVTMRRIWKTEEHSCKMLILIISIVRLK